VQVLADMPTAGDNRLWLSVAEAAWRLSLSKAEVRRRQWEIGFVKVGRRILVPSVNVERYAAAIQAQQETARGRYAP
jgi:excisionase family DNA binding protein